MSYNINISKSAFVRGKQCYKSLYLNKHHQELEDKISETQQATFDKGAIVGLLAQKLFPGGIDLNKYILDNFSIVFSETERLLATNYPTIYEAGFKFENLMCFVDILDNVNGRWYAYEIKGSTSVKDVFLWDIAFQYHVITSLGIVLEDTFVVYINNQYEKNGELNIQELFTIESVKDRVLPLLPKVRTHINQMKSMLNSNTIPDISIGSQCSNPYPCSFSGHCWKNIPSYSIFNISRLSSDKKFGLYEQGIVEIVDVPVDFPLSDNQQLQVLAEKSGETIINEHEIRAFINSLQYPLYFLDFETFQSGIPMFDHSRPFQQITFQYSLHIQEKSDTKLIHKEFLAKAKDDPRIPLIEHLIKDIGISGSVIVYNKGFETARLNEIAKDFPIYKNQVENMISRVIDLMVPFSQKHYYTPKMKGSYSIKKVLPALVPKLSYKGLSIAQGGDASLAFVGLYSETDKTKISQTRKDLLEYCGLDTFAMVEILRVLKQL